VRREARPGDSKNESKSENEVKEGRAALLFPARAGIFSKIFAVIAARLKAAGKSFPDSFVTRACR
jgi:hypothetical protein